MTNQLTISARHNKKPPTAAQDTATRLWQKFLNLKIDGVFGPKTTEATKVYQNAHGLKDDGEVGPKTWATVPDLKANPAAQPTPLQQQIASNNATVTAANAIKQAVKPPAAPIPKPPAAPRPKAPDPVKLIGQAATVARQQTVAAVNASTQFATNTAKQATEVYKKQPLWIRVATGAGVVIGVIFGFKVLTEPKRKSA